MFSFISNLIVLGAFALAVVAASNKTFHIVLAESVKKRVGLTVGVGVFALLVLFILPGWLPLVGTLKWSILAVLGGYVGTRLVIYGIKESQKPQTPNGIN